MGMIVFALFLLFPIIIGGTVVMVKMADQSRIDKTRKTYRLAFPADLDPDRVTAFIRSTSGILRVSKMSRYLNGAPTICYETWGTSGGVVWRIKVPYGYEPAVRRRLEDLIPGIQLVPEDEFPVRVWVYAEEMKLRAGHRAMNIKEPSDISTAILGNFGQLADGETLCQQIIIAPAIPEHKPQFGIAASKEQTLWSVLAGTTVTRDEVAERRDKLEEPNMLCVIRVGAVASTKARAHHLVRDVTSAYDQTRGAANYFESKTMVSLESLRKRITNSTTSLDMPVQLNAPELACFIAWPLNNPILAGLPSAVSRRLPTPNSVPSQGIVFGMSNYAGRERKVALGYKEALIHQHIIGPPGVGKTVFLTNEFRQIVDAGHGAIVVERKGDLFEAALDQIPSNRIDDVIVLNMSDVRWPVGFNLLQQGDPAIMVDEIRGVFKQLYANNPSLWTDEAIYHALHTLALDKNATIIDVLALVAPASDEFDWADNLRRQVKDPQLRRYWQELENKGIRDQMQKLDPLKTRWWPMTRPKVQNVFGQSQSSFTIEDVIKNNQILLINLAGIEYDAATLVGTLLINTIWQQVQANPQPTRPNYLLMDEAHHYFNLPVDLNLMLNEARSFGLGMVFAHQHLAQLPTNMKQALMHSAQTKVVFQTTADDAKELSRVLGGGLADRDLAGLPQYDAVARVATPLGVSSALTLTTSPPPRGYGNAQRVIYASRGKYGRSIEAVQDEILSRRNVEKRSRRANPKPNIEGWGSI